MNRDNAHMNADCAAIAHLLALRDTGALDPDEATRVERHLATCDACLREARLDSALAGSLRRTLSAPAAAPMLSMDEVRRAIERATDSEASLAPTGPATSTRPTPQRHPSAHPWRGALTAIAAALVIVFFASYIFGSIPRRGGVALAIPTTTASTLLAQETVYLPTGAGIFAIRASDGVVRWTYPAGIDKPPVTQWRDILDLTLGQGTLYALSTSSDAQGAVTLLALDTSDGAVRWSKTEPATMNSLLLVGNLLIVTALGPVADGAPGIESATGQAIEARNAVTGAPVWSHPLQETELATPVAASGAIYLGTVDHVVALNANDGTLRWSTPIIPSVSQDGTTFVDVNASVALAATSDTVYVLAKRAMSQGSAAAWEDNVYALNTVDGSHLWLNSSENDPSSRVFAPTIAGDVAYIPFFGGLVAFPAATPGTFNWRFIPAGAGNGNTAVAMTGAAVSAGVVYTTDLTGVSANNGGGTVWENFTYAVRATDGVELWRTPTNGGINAAAPVVISGVVFASSVGVLRALRASDGRQMWMDALPSGDRLASPIAG